MRDRLMELHVPGERKGRFFVVSLPSYGEKDSHRQATSFSWFRERELTRAFPDAPEGLMRGVPWNQYADGVRHCTEHALHGGETPDGHLAHHWDLPPGTAVRCSDLWDFYARIGYDWKAKKYVRQD